MGAASALSWYFLLAPIYLQSGESQLGKLVNLAYPLWDLCLLFGLTVALIYRHCLMGRAVLVVLIGAVLCLVVADSLAAWLLLYPSHVYQTGHPSDVFWDAFYLLVPLAALMKLRVTQYQLAYVSAVPTPAEELAPVQKRRRPGGLPLSLPVCSGVAGQRADCYAGHYRPTSPSASFSS